MEVVTIEKIRWTEIYPQRMMYTKWSTTAVSPKQVPWFIMVQIVSNNIVRKIVRFTKQQRILIPGRSDLDWEKIIILWDDNIWTWIRDFSN